MTRDNILSAIGACVRKLTRAPSSQEFTSLTGIKTARLLLHFPDVRSAVRAAGMETRPKDFPVSQKALLTDWAEVVRKLKRLPTWGQYFEEGAYDPQIYKRRFGSLLEVARRFLRYARKISGWKDVVKIIRYQVGNNGYKYPPQTTLFDPDKAGPGRARSRASGPSTVAPRSARPILGAPLPLGCLTHAPVNEQGVVFLFGIVARRLGFRVECVQTGFPDCEAKRELRPGQWQHVRIEFEFESKNFERHRHDATQCDIIVCWKHTWPDMPEHLDVVELRQVVRHMVRSRARVKTDKG